MAHEKQYSQLWNSTCHWWMEILHYYIFFFASSTQEISNLKCQSFFSFFKHMFKTHSNEHNQFDMITRRYKTKEVLFCSKIQNILASELIHCIKRFHIRSCNFEIMKLTLQKLFKKLNKFAVKCTLSWSPKTKWSKKWEHTQFSIWNKESCLEARKIYHW